MHLSPHAPLSAPEKKETRPTALCPCLATMSLSFFTPLLWGRLPGYIIFLFVSFCLFSSPLRPPLLSHGLPDSTLTPPPPFTPHSLFFPHSFLVPLTPFLLLSYHTCREHPLLEKSTLHDHPNRTSAPDTTRVEKGPVSATIPGHHSRDLG